MLQETECDAFGGTLVPASDGGKRNYACFSCSGLWDSFHGTRAAENEAQKTFDVVKHWDGCPVWLPHIARATRDSLRDPQRERL